MSSNTVMSILSRVTSAGLSVIDVNSPQANHHTVIEVG